MLDVDKFPLSRPRGDGGSGVGFEDRSHGGDVVSLNPHPILPFSLQF